MKPELLKARLDKVEAMREQILAAGDKAQEIRRLPDDIVQELVKEGFFRFALPTAARPVGAIMTMSRQWGIDGRE